MANSSHDYILVTGANAGLGLGICHLLISDFLSTSPPTSHLNLLFTTRSPAKSLSTSRTLTAHITCLQATSRIHLHSLEVELTSLLSVSTLLKTLSNDPTIPHLNALILNAGIAGTTGINFPLAIYQILTENAAAVTWPRFKRSAVGSITERQFPDSTEPEPPLGQVFTANVFGHYVLAHGLMGLLKAAPGKPGRVIWMSSIEASEEHFAPGDLMGLRSQTAYEHSKRVTDLLALTADSEAARGWMGEGPRPRVLLCHPGIVATGIVPLPKVLMSLWIGTAYVMRWAGSPWHTNTAGKGAVSAVWLALAGEEELDAEGAGRVKWGSVVERWGATRVEMTDVKGWGVDGSGREIKGKWWGGGWGRVSGAVDAKAEDVEEFRGQGERVWREMEGMRVEWEGRVKKYEKKGSRRS